MCGRVLILICWRRTRLPETVPVAECEVIAGAMALVFSSSTCNFCFVLYQVVYLCDGTWGMVSPSYTGRECDASQSDPPPFPCVNRQLAIARLEKQ